MPTWWCSERILKQTFDLLEAFNVPVALILRIKLLVVFPRASLVLQFRRMLESSAHEAAARQNIQVVLFVVAGDGCCVQGPQTRL